MVKTFDNHITLADLHLQTGDISGNFISGGTIQNFASTGIQDLATSVQLVVTDGMITVPAITVTTATISTIQGNTVIRGDVKVYGIIDAGFVRTTEIVANQRYEKQYVEFALDGIDGNNVGTGLLWPSNPYNKLFVYRNNPDRFFLSESVDLAPGRQFSINGSLMLNETQLGGSVTNSSLQTVGILQNLTVNGPVNFSEQVFFDGTHFAIGNAEPNKLFSVYNEQADVDFYIDGDSNSRARVGTANNRAVDLVSDDQVRISMEASGDITLGQEMIQNTTVRVYGQLSVGIKNPVEQFEVAGNMRLGGRLFAQANSVPTEGHYNQGDIIYSTNPIPSGWLGWVCVQSGFPGQWKPFGQIGA